MFKISCLILAAGRSSRMDGVNKLLLSVGGQSLVRRTAQEILLIPFQQVVVITGFESEKIESEISDLPVTFVHNENYLSGMHSSIRRGLQDLAKPCDGFFVCLSDQPALSHQVLQKMILNFEMHQGKKIIYPSFAGARGQPVLIPQRFISEILDHVDGDHGCNYLLKKYPEHTIEVPLSGAEPLFDIDTRADLSAFMEVPRV